MEDSKNFCIFDLTRFRYEFPQSKVACTYQRQIHSSTREPDNREQERQGDMVWDLARPSANQLVVLSGKSRLIQAQWTPDGRDIITAWSDGSLGVWSGATKEDLASLVHETGEFGESYYAWRDSLATAKKRKRD